MKRYLNISLLLIGLCILALGNNSCANSPYSYGIVSLKVSESQEVYFKREARGLNHDSLVLSANKDYCAEPSPQVDFIFHASGSHSIYYKIENGILIMYPSSAATPPESRQFPVKVVQYDLTTLDYAELQKNHEKLGLKYLEVKLDEKLKCK